MWFKSLIKSRLSPQSISGGKGAGRQIVQRTQQTAQSQTSSRGGANIRAVLSKMGRMKVDNGFKVEINYYRPGTTIADGFIVVLMSFLVFLRLLLRWKIRREDHDEDFRELVGGRLP